MAVLLSKNPATGGPGIEPRWAQGDKDGIGTAFSDSSPLWFTIAAGVVTEVYYPTVDTPQIRDLQLLVTDGESFFHDGRRDFKHEVKLLHVEAQAYELTNTAIGQPYKIIQTIIANPKAPCLLIHSRIEADPAFLAKLRVFVLLSPHVQGRGGENHGYVAKTPRREFLVANRAGRWLALGADSAFLTRSCGFVGVNDGWTDIVGARRAPKFDFDCATNGNIALTGEIDLSKGPTFLLGLAFGEGDDSNPHNALVLLTQTLSFPFDGPQGHLAEFVQSWKTSAAAVYMPKPNITSDNDVLFGLSRNVLLVHEDKISSGALVASMSLPWGQYNGDQDGGYHLVWPRDMCQSATALLAAGMTHLPLRGLIYLAESQLPGGGFDQNFFINGERHWAGHQLDEYSFPIILAYRLKLAGALHRFDPTPMVLKAAGALIADGPMTQQERWEENEGYSPSTLAANIAALVCAASFADSAADNHATAQFLLEYADWLETKLEAWTVTTAGTLHPQVKTHYIRILPTQVKGDGPKNPSLPEDPNTAVVTIANRNNLHAPAREIVDAGFLELVRYGIRPATDPIIVDSLKVVDLSLKDDLPDGPCWRRYTQDGYGETDEGAPFLYAGVGRPWPLLAGERAHYELAAGKDVRPFIKSMENFAGKGGLLPEQIWNRPFTPAGTHLVLGGPTGSAMPLCWAHAEYVKLVRSASDGKVFDLIDIVADRYLAPHPASKLEVWNFDRQFKSIPRGKTIRIPLNKPFRLRWTHDRWATFADTVSTGTLVDISYVDIPTDQAGSSEVIFTFFWTDYGTWQGQNFEIAISG
ncbi:glycoside hydrolase family 15 protein [uncultured Rhodoblastus sp.]|uniref:glycoside hydrolase family 15 protein n=1 Tax=uncultured Rhodoblastus sp. TaxID=543037 RepID=UPI0025EBFB00|nr:glycoside hydrolase family 15 protein [uncultured Rhodoblastus sp.]